MKQCSLTGSPAGGYPQHLLTCSEILDAAYKYFPSDSCHLTFPLDAELCGSTTSPPPWPALAEPPLQSPGAALLPAGCMCAVGHHGRAHGAHPASRHNASARGNRAREVPAWGSWGLAKGTAPPSLGQHGHDSAPAPRVQIPANAALAFLKPECSSRNQPLGPHSGP